MSKVSVFAIVALVLIVGAIVYGGACRMTDRARVSEGLSLASGVRTAVAEFYLDNERFPDNNEEAGVSQPDVIQGKWVSSVDVQAGGLVVITFGNEMPKRLQDWQILLTAEADDDKRVSWTCAAPQFRDRDVPAACRTEN